MDVRWRRVPLKQTTIIIILYIYVCVYLLYNILSHTRHVGTRTLRARGSGRAALIGGLDLPWDKSPHKK
jgi:hypothetical protein